MSWRAFPPKRSLHYSFCLFFFDHAPINQCLAIVALSCRMLSARVYVPCGWLLQLRCVGAQSYAVLPVARFPLSSPTHRTSSTSQCFRTQERDRCMRFIIHIDRNTVTPFSLRHVPQPKHIHPRVLRLAKQQNYKTRGSKPVCLCSRSSLDLSASRARI